MLLKILVDTDSSSLLNENNTLFLSHWIHFIRQPAPRAYNCTCVLLDLQHIEAACLSIRPDDQLQLV